MIGPTVADSEGIFRPHFLFGKLYYNELFGEKRSYFEKRYLVAKITTAGTVERTWGK